MKDLDAYQDQMSVGQVKSITTGSVLNFVELLISDSTKTQFYYDKENNNVQVTFSDTDLRIPDVSTIMTKETLRDYISGLKTMYGQLLTKKDEV